MPTNFVFLNVDDPRLFKQEKHKTLVQSHVGKLNRSRSASTKPANKNERILKLIELRARKTVRDERHCGVQRIPLREDHERPAFTQGESAAALSNSSPQQAPSLMKDIIQILPVSQQMDYGSSPTRCLVSETSEHDESSEEKDLLDEWATFISFYPRQGRVDPFAKYPVDCDDSDLQISRLVDHATSTFWSVLTPHDQFGQTNPVNHTYLSHMRHSMLAFYCYTIAISHNFDFLSAFAPTAKIYSSLRAKHLHAATKMVRKQIEGMPANPAPEQIPDELIGSVITLAANYRINVVGRESQEGSKFRSPLAALQCLDMWGLLPLLPPHLLAVIQLVNLKGGLRGVQSVDLAGVVQLVDLLDASRRLKKPMLPWENFGAYLPISVWPSTLDDKSCESTSDLAKGFLTLPVDVLYFGGMPTSIAAISHTVDRLTEYFSNGCPKSAMFVLCESRNRSQHFALSLPQIFGNSNHAHQADLPEAKQSLPQLHQHLYEIVRLTILIFNNIVTYPLPPLTGLDTQLARLLKDELYTATTEQPVLRSQYSGLLLWSMVLGGISDHHNLQRSWYIDQAREILQNMPHLRRWIVMEQLLTSFLWLDFVLNEEAIKFWVEVSYMATSKT